LRAFTFAFALSLAIADIQCQPAPKHCAHPGISVPRSIAIVGDSRIHDPATKNFGGFTNYLGVRPELNAFVGAQFTYEDSDPTTTWKTPGSDAYCSVGNTVFYAVRNLEKVLKNGHDGIIVSLGVNSTGDPAGTIAALDTITSTAASRGLTVIITTIGPWKGYPTWTAEYQKGTELVNDWIRSTVKRHYIVIDVYRILEDENRKGSIKSEYTWDSLHFTWLGHAFIAEEANRQMAIAKACAD